MAETGFELRASAGYINNFPDASSEVAYTLDIIVGEIQITSQSVQSQSVESEFVSSWIPE